MAQKLEFLATNTDKDANHNFNWTRTMYCAGFGLITGAPLIQWFKFLERFDRVHQLFTS